MIAGHVNALQARIEVSFRLTGQPDAAIGFVVDTGFAGALSLPQAAISALGFPFFEQIDAILADDTAVQVDGHFATIGWDGTDLDIAVLAMGRRSLLGTALLDGRRLTADFVDNGPVSLASLP
jgi:clan AA aspartic protease